MTILNVSLCLPALDIFALQHQHSIVAVTKRFIVPGKSFTLLPCCDFPENYSLEDLYRSDFLASVATEKLPAAVSSWATCALCQPLTTDSEVDEITQRTIWTTAALQQHLRSGDSLFLSFLRVYTLPAALEIKTKPACEQLYKFIPLPSYIEAAEQNEVLTAQVFSERKEQFLTPQNNENISRIEPDANKAVGEAHTPLAEDILCSPSWETKIADVGNSSDGHTFEKLVRKGLLELGFSNSSKDLAAGLNPDATGGAGGLDFYADKPYQIVGECKASKTSRINSDAATQLVRLGLQNLQPDEYPNCVKIVVAAGTLTRGANRIAEGHRINVIRPEVMQKLVISKLTLEDDFDLFQLKGSLEAEPFGEDADQKLSNYIDWCIGEWSEKREYVQLVEQVIKALEELSQQAIASPFQDFSTIEVRAHHNAKYQPVVTTVKVAQILENQYIQSSCVGRRTHPNGSIGYYLKGR